MMGTAVVTAEFTAAMPPWRVSPRITTTRCVAAENRYITGHALSYVLTMMKSDIVASRPLQCAVLDLESSGHSRSDVTPSLYVVLQPNHRVRGCTTDLPLLLQLLLDRRHPQPELPKEAPVGPSPLTFMRLCPLSPKTLGLSQ